MKFKKLTAAAMAAAMLTAAVPLAVTLNNAISVTANAEETEVKTEGDWAYKVNEDGETVTLSTYIGTDAEIAIPADFEGKSVTSIGGGAFWYYTNLTSVTIPNSVTEIGKLAFTDCTSLTEITVDENNAEYCSVDGVLFNKDKTELMCYPAGKTAKSYTIPNSVTKLWRSAFFSCASLKSVTIPNSVTELDDDVFSCCTSLTSVTIPDNVTSIGKWAFDSCPNLTSITLPKSITSIEAGLFRYCTGIISIDIPDSVTSIDSSAFRGCSNLTSITMPSGVTSIGNFTFDECPSLTTVNYSGKKEEWNAIEIGDSNECLTNAEIICTDGIINEREPETSEPTSNDTSEPASSTTSEPATSDISAPAESTVTPGSTDPVSKPTSSTDEPTVLEATLKNVDSEKGIEGAALDELLFGESGWTWAQVEKIVFTSDSLFSVQYTAVDGTTKTLGEKPAQRAEDDGIWSTEWTLDTSLMSKDKSFVKLIAKDGTADIKATIYIKKDAEKPTTGDDQANTGIALAIAPAALACAAVIAASKKRK